MIPRFLILILIGLACHGEAKWVSLFDGKSLKGWKQCNGSATYRVEEGTILGRTAEGSPNSFLCSEKEYGDFILEFEVKTDPVLNSGVQFRSHRYAADAKVMTFNGKEIVERKHETGRVHGYQVEVATEKSGASGGVYDEARRGWLHNSASDPASAKAFKDNEWNRYRVEANGDLIKTFVNDVPCANFVDSMDLRGFLALQVHQYKGEKPAEVRWRNIRIQDLGAHTWKPLWDGKSMKGWKVTAGDWKTEDGAAHAQSKQGDEKIGFMISDRSFTDGTFRVQYRIAKGNSGFFVRTDPATMAAYEVEIDDTKGSGGLFETGGRRWVTGPENNALQKNDGWNDLVASVHGDRIVFHLNGVKTVDLPNDTVGRKQGVVALQVHGKRQTEVWFRNVEFLEKR